MEEGGGMGRNGGRRSGLQAAHKRFIIAGFRKLKNSNLSAPEKMKKVNKAWKKSAERKAAMSKAKKPKQSKSKKAKKSKGKKKAKKSKKSKK